MVVARTTIVLVDRVYVASSTLVIVVRMFVARDHCACSLIVCINIFINLIYVCMYIHMCFYCNMCDKNNLVELKLNIMKKNT